MATREYYRNLTSDFARKRFPVPPNMADYFYRQMQIESRDFDPEVVECRFVNSPGAMGIGQFIPRWHPNISIEDMCNAEKALPLAADYLEFCIRETGIVRAGFAAYNAGPGIIGRLVNQYGDKWEQHLDQELEPDKVKEVRAYLNHIYNTGDVMAAEIVPAGYTIETKFSPNTQGNRSQTLGVMIHSTRSGKLLTPQWTLEHEYEATKNWFMNTQSGLSVHWVVGPTKICRMLHDDAMGIHAGEHNPTHIGIEIAQPNTTVPYTDFQIEAAAEITALYCKKYNVPVKFTSQTAREAGITGHENSEQGRQQGKSDPGPMFDWLRFINIVSNKTLPQPEPEDPDRRDLINLYNEMYGRLVELAVSTEEVRTEVDRLMGGIEDKIQDTSIRLEEWRVYMKVPIPPTKE